jgi:ribosomal protein S18 acetylase RimI-like enzyme
MSPRARSAADDGLHVRPATTRDAAVLAAFNAALAAESEDKQLEPRRLAEGVAAVLADERKGRYFVAERRGEVLGCLMLTTEWSDWRNGVFWWVQSVYVIPSARAAGVFRSLYGHVLEAARADPGVCGLRLYVEHGNERAKRVYSAVGMHPTSYEVYELDFVQEGGSR